MNKNLKSKIIELAAQGKTYNQIGKELSCSKGTIAFHLSPTVKANTYKRSRDSRIVLKKKLKIDAGGKCSRCQYDTCLEALDFHHKDPSNKLYNVGRDMYEVGMKLIKEEVKKCVLICSNCHRELHAGIWQLD
jgi:hypothetical protein